MVVPKHEQSWKGKSMTRFGHLQVEEIEIAGHKAFSVDGSPADCVNLALHNLFGGNKPDLVVSGINAGLNTGVGFVLSSGTVGACFEANIARVPALALSQFFDAETRDHYIASYSIPEKSLKYFCVNAKSVIEKLFTSIVKSKDLLTDSLTLNVNLPFKAKDPLEYKVCPLGFSRYGSCFRKDAQQTSGANSSLLGRYQHDLTDYQADSDPLTDYALLREGYVTLTPIDLRLFGRIESAVADNLKAAISTR